VDCIDQWLRLNVKCPRCRCSVFPNLDLSALNGLRTEPPEPPVRSLPVSDLTTTTSSVVTSSDVSRYIRSVGPAAQSQSYLLRLQGLLCPVRVESSGVRPAILENDGSHASVLEAVPPHHCVVIDPQFLPDRWLIFILFGVIVDKFLIALFTNSQSFLLTIIIRLLHTTQWRKKVVAWWNGPFKNMRLNGLNKFKVSLSVVVASYY
jgi:hypothetical protein